MHSSIFVVLNRAIPGAPAARDGRSLALWASVNLFTKGCHEGVWSNGPIGLPPYEVLRLGSPANTGGLRGARAGPSSLRV